MKTILSESAVKAPDNAGLPPVVIRRPVTRKAVAQPRHLVICAECRFAQLYAEEPLARCTCSTSEFAKDVVFAGRPACTWMTPLDGDDLSLAWCTPGLKTAHARFVQPRPRVR